jgi:hypothetical protein
LPEPLWICRPIASTVAVTVRRSTAESSHPARIPCRELRELCRLQEQAGDSVGARDTIAAALAGPQPGHDKWLVPLSLVGIAVAEAEAGACESAR